MKFKVTDASRDLPTVVQSAADSFTEVLEDLTCSTWSAEAMSRVLVSTFEHELSQASQRGSEIDNWSPPDGAFGYIPVDIQRFLRLFFLLDTELRKDRSLKQRGMPYRPLKVLEIGCGAGRNLRLLRDGEVVKWAELVGIDINGPMIELGRTLVGPGIDLRIDDAMSHDLQEYDVIFTYRPFMDDAMELAFEERVRRDMRVGAYLLAPIWMDQDPSQRMERLDRRGELFRKIA